VLGGWIREDIIVCKDKSKRMCGRDLAIRTAGEQLSVPTHEFC